MVKNVNVKNSDNICWQIYLYVAMCYLFFFCRRKRASSHAGLRSTLFLRRLQDPPQTGNVEDIRVKGKTGQRSKRDASC